MLKFSLFVYDRFTFFIIPLEKRQDAVDFFLRSNVIKESTLIQKPSAQNFIPLIGME